MFKLDLKRKISKRIHPWPLIVYDLKRGWRGFRKRKTAMKYGEPINCHGADHIHIYMTLQCPMRCKLCINRLLLQMNHEEFDEYAKNYPEKKGIGYWRDFLNRLWNVRELYFNGGEHSTVHNFGLLINLLDNFNINIFSNLHESGIEEIEAIRKNNNNIIIKSSYHPLRDDTINLYMERVKCIHKSILWCPHIIRWPGVSVKMYIDAFSRYGVTATPDDNVYNPSQQRKPLRTVMCKTNEHNVGPDMKVYRCLLHMLRGIRGVPIDEYSWKHEWIKCDLYPFCKTHTAYNEIKLLD